MVVPSSGILPCTGRAPACAARSTQHACSGEGKTTIKSWTAGLHGRLGADHQQGNSSNSMLRKHGTSHGSLAGRPQRSLQPCTDVFMETACHAQDAALPCLLPAWPSVADDKQVPLVMGHHVSSHWGNQAHLAACSSLWVCAACSSKTVSFCRVAINSCCCFLSCSLNLLTSAWAAQAAC